MYKRQLLDHAPGVVSYLLPCLRSELGQTAAFAARAVCALARSEEELLRLRLDLAGVRADVEDMRARADDDAGP